MCKDITYKVRVNVYILEMWRQIFHRGNLLLWQISYIEILKVGNKHQHNNVTLKRDTVPNMDISNGSDEVPRTTNNRDTFPNIETYSAPNTTHLNGPINGNSASNTSINTNFSHHGVINRNSATNITIHTDTVPSTAINTGTVPNMAIITGSD